MTEIKDVSKWYGNFQVLTGCTISVKKGEVVMACGPSGSGKSTLIKTVNTLESFQKGGIFVNDISVDAKNINLPKLRSYVSMVFQDFELLPHFLIAKDLTIAQQKVLDRPKEEAMAKGLKCLDRMNLEMHAAKYLDQLSGSQQQRVAVVRALSMDPICMLFDEPTFTLDPEMVNETFDAMMELAKEGMTTMCVTHEVGFARKAVNRVIFTDQDRIAEDCGKEEFFGNTDVHPDHVKQFLSKILSY